MKQAPSPTHADVLAALEALHQLVTKTDYAFSWPNVYAGIIIDRAKRGKASG